MKLTQNRLKTVNTVSDDVESKDGSQLEKRVDFQAVEKSWLIQVNRMAETVHKLSS